MSDRIDKCLEFLQSCTQGELKYIYGQIAIGMAATDLRKKVGSDKEFFAKIDRSSLSRKNRGRFLAGAYDYGIKDIAALEAWRSEILQEVYTATAIEMAATDATLLHTCKRVPIDIGAS